MSSIVDGFQILNGAPGNTTAAKLKGEKYAVLVNATFGGGNLQLQALALDGTSWINVGSTITAAGLTNFDLPPGQYRFAITTATAVYAAVTGVPA
jgi:hypothetical protein